MGVWEEYGGGTQPQHMREHPQQSRRDAWGRSQRISRPQAEHSARQKGKALCTKGEPPAHAVGSVLTGQDKENTKVEDRRWPWTRVVGPIAGLMKEAGGQGLE